MQAIPIPCFQGIARWNGRDSGDCAMSITHDHAACIVIYTQSGMTNYPVYPTL